MDSQPHDSDAHEPAVTEEMACRTGPYMPGRPPQEKDGSPQPLTELSQRPPHEPLQMLSHLQHSQLPQNNQWAPLVHNGLPNKGPHHTIDEPASSIPATTRSLIPTDVHARFHAMDDFDASKFAFGTHYGRAARSPWTEPHGWQSLEDQVAPASPPTVWTYCQFLRHTHHMQCPENPRYARTAQCLQKFDTTPSMANAIAHQRYLEQLSLETSSSGRPPANRPFPPQQGAQDPWMQSRMEKK